MQKRQKLCWQAVFAASKYSVRQMMQARGSSLAVPLAPNPIGHSRGGFSASAVSVGGGLAAAA